MFYRIFPRFLSAVLMLIAGVAAHALTIDDYDQKAVEKAQESGKSVVLAFHADWCPTCRAQAKVFEQLKAVPMLKDVTIYNVDYDGETELKKMLKVRGQSTLIVYKGKKEVARSVADTSVDSLKQLLSKAL